ncbi:MAG: hypothetical protein IT497_06200, partial [Ottowia sp.]|nr:hypothetical protein [Ottowia sp.]
MRTPRNIQLSPYFLACCVSWLSFFATPCAAFYPSMVLADNQVSPPASQQPAEANVLRAINRAHNEFAPPARTEINPDMDPLLPDLGDASSRA